MASGQGCIAAGNILGADAVPQGMVDAFSSERDAHLAERLVRSLEAGERAGGEEGPVRSAGVKVVSEHVWPIVDLRVDWHDDPIAELRGIWQVYEPQADDYLRRAVNPSSAPSYGVPGDL